MYSSRYTFWFIVSAVAAVDTTQPCSQQPNGYGPIPSPNTDTAFLSYGAYGYNANRVITPAGYTQTFKNLNASEFATSANSYLGYYELKSYEASACTAICDNTVGCVGTNLYFERAPAQLPAPACPNPTAISLIKCALWGSPVTPQDATNFGQYQEQFHVVVAGSNGYMKLPLQACAAISSAYSASTYNFPTGTTWISSLSSSASAAQKSSVTSYGYTASNSTVKPASTTTSTTVQTTSTTTASATPSTYAPPPSYGAPRDIRLKANK